MKLRTKFQDEDFDYGEVVDAEFINSKDKITVRMKAKKGGIHTFYYQTLKEFYEDFEDGEEYESYWYIGTDGLVQTRGFRLMRPTQTDEMRMKIGNHFETKEDAMLAVKKLKAWKRLKDKGFRFIRIDKPNYGETFAIIACLPKDTLVIDTAKDIDLLFGGEE